ncbi:MAG TPA: hypothetical protein VFS97_08710 [Nitrososphaeraceae archaeon]|nr:hypothetical protein [Nitrososphaeraceae archaeon]
MDLVSGVYVWRHDGFDYHKAKAGLIMIKSAYRMLKDLDINDNRFK